MSGPEYAGVFIHGRLDDEAVRSIVRQHVDGEDVRKWIGDFVPDARFEADVAYLGEVTWVTVEWVPTRDNPQGWRARQADLSGWYLGHLPGLAGTFAKVLGRRAYFYYYASTHDFYAYWEAFAEDGTRVEGRALDGEEYAHILDEAYERTGEESEPSVAESVLHRPLEEILGLPAGSLDEGPGDSVPRVPWQWEETAERRTVVL